MEFEHRVAPDLRQALARMPHVILPDDLEKFRNSPPPVESKHVITTDQIIQGSDGDIRLKVYQPIQKSESKLPAMLWMHGGGFVLGHPNTDDRLCENFALGANCVVVSVDYRLAPEHPYPAALHDCYEALEWMITPKAQLDIDVSRIAVAGSSAGGGLAAAVCLMARDKGGPKISFQMLLYPMIDDRNCTPSSFEITNTVVWHRANNLWAWKMYLGGHASEVPPYAAPARVENLANLPPTYACVGGLDLFRDETIDYVTRLAQAGVQVEFHLYPGGFHGFERIVSDAEISQRASQEYFNALAIALNCD